MTRTLNDPTFERASRQPTGDALHHPPKPAHVGLGRDNEPATRIDRDRATIESSAASDQRSIADLIKELRDEATHLIRQEINLAKTEVSEKTSFFGKQAGKLGAGGAVLAVGALMVLSAVAYGVAWLFQRFFEFLVTSSLAAGFLIVGAIVAIIGYAMYRSAISGMRREPLVPEKTIHSLKEDKQWLTHKTTEAVQ